MAVKKNSVSSIKARFNSRTYLEETKWSYGLDKPKEKEAKVEFDPYEALREKLILGKLRQELAKGGAVLDIGCGLGNLVWSLNKSPHFVCDGIDISENVVAFAKNRLVQSRISKGTVELGDFIRKKPGKKYDAAIANGVIWYYQDRTKFLKKVNASLNKGGTALIIHRNDLFNVFALNNGTIDFFERSLYKDAEFISGKNCAKAIKKKVPGLATPIRRHSSSVLKKYYDNPLDIRAMYEKAGFSVQDILYTYVHLAPPRLGLKPKSRDFALAQKKFGHRWEGMFMASQFLVVAKKK